MLKHKSLFVSLGIETKKEAVTRLQILTARLARAAATGPGIDLLLNCTSSSPCLTEACPVCRRKFRRNLVRENEKLGLTQGLFSRASLVPNGLLWPSGDLQKVNLIKLIQRFRKQIERSELSEFTMTGGFDISFNTFNNGDIGWQGHLYLLINQPYSAGLERLFRNSFKFDPNVPRPFSLKPVAPGEFLKCLTYSYKNEFYTRSGYFEERLTKDGRPRKNQRPQPLNLARTVELTTWLSAYRVGSRLILRNVRRITPPNSRKLSLQLMKPITIDDS